MQTNANRETKELLEQVISNQEQIMNALQLRPAPPIPQQAANANPVDDDPRQAVPLADQDAADAPADILRDRLESIRLRSTSRTSFAVLLLKELFNEHELLNKTMKGNRLLNKASLSPRRSKLLIDKTFQFYELKTGESRERAEYNVRQAVDHKLGRILKKNRLPLRNPAPAEAPAAAAATPAAPAAAAEANNFEDLASDDSFGSGDYPDLR